MALTEEEFHEQKRRKMRLQADLNVRRNSLMNLVAPTDLRGMSSDIQNMTSQAQEMEANIRNTLSGTPQTVQTAEVYNAARNERRKMMLQAARNARIGLQFQAAAPQPIATDYGPGLTPAAAEELYGPGGMYGTTPLPGGLYAAQLPATRSIFNPGESASIGSQGVRQSTRQSTAAFPSDERLKSSSSSLTDAVKKIKKRVAIIRGTAALVGGDQKAADRYEAKALASLGIYAGQYALSQLTDTDFQNKARFIQAANKSLMPFDMITDLLPHIGPDLKGKTKAQEVVRLIGPDGVEFTGKTDWSTGEAKLLRMDGTPVASGTNLAPTKPPVEKKFINWTDGDKNIAIREGEPGPPGFWVGKAGEDPKGTSMRFIDPEGVGHLGYVQHDETGVPRYYLNNGSPVPEGWDMASPTASKITNNLSLQGEKMGEARQIAMAKMSRKWSNDAASYFFDEVGRFKADRLDIIKATLDVPGEGRLAWTQMKNALAAALRLESGAAIGVEEAANYKERFFPKMTDTEKTIIWKLRAFNDYVRALETINNPQWVYENLPHPAWNPKKVKTEKERDALPHGSYFITPSGNLGRYVPNQTEAEVLLQ